MDRSKLNLVLKYREQGLSILPADGKRPAVKRLKPYIDGKRVADEEQLRFLFEGRTELNIAIVCGPPSGGLVVADFDDPIGYGNWAQQHPELAATAPTVETGRGFHVWTHSDFGRIQKMPYGGELRGKGIVIGPNSKHPSGRLYRWLNPLGEIPIVDPAVFLSGIPSTQPTQPTQADTQTHGMCVSNVADAIRVTIPTAYGQREGRLFALARWLKWIIPDAGPDELRNIVREWHKLALQNIRTKQFDASWTDFTRSWGRVKRPAGQPGWADAIAIAETIPLQACGLIYDSEPYHRLVKLVAALHQVWGGADFPLSCRKVAEHCGVCEKTGANMLKTLVFDGVLQVHGKHPPGKRLAHEYRFQIGVAK